MNDIVALFPFICVLAWLGVVIYLIVLAKRLVRAQERLADTLDKIANKLSDNGKP